MRRRDFLIRGVAGLSLGTVVGCARPATFSTPRRLDGPPNMVIIYTDDQGYGDVGCYGAHDLNTPHWDRMAAEGMRFTDFYSSAPVCTPARASLMTGCYPARVSMDHFPELLDTPVPHDRVIFPPQPFGLHTEETTLAQLLKRQGYRTACIGKWHLGHETPFLPPRRGFELYYGIPYSNDMKPSVLMRQERVIEEPVEQASITQRYTEVAKDFMRNHQAEPFFLYLAHSMPHLPLHLPPEYQKRSQRGIYGDIIEMLDWSTGEILNEIRELGLSENTLVVFTSDNGPVRRFGEERGQVGPLRGGKGTIYEGGMRVPAIFWWPGHIPAGRTCRAMATVMDLYPTFAQLAGAQLPQDRKIDGHDIRPLLYGETPYSPYDAFYYYRGGELLGVRSGPWKLTLEMPASYEHRTGDGNATDMQPEALYHLENDIGETHNVIADYPEVAERLHRWLRQARATMGDTRLDIGGHERRPLGVYIPTTDAS